MSERKKGLVHRLVHITPGATEFITYAIGESLASASYPFKDKIIHFFIKTGDNRTWHEQQKGERVGFKYRVLKTFVEMVPIGGDALTIIEGFIGEELPKGRKLDVLDRVVSIGVGAFPIAPATPLRETIRAGRRGLEEGVWDTVQKHSMFEDPFVV